MCQRVRPLSFSRSLRRSSCQQSQSGAESPTPRQRGISSGRPRRRCAVSSFCRRRHHHHRHPLAAAACRRRGRVIIAGAKYKIGEGRGGTDYGALRMKCQRWRVFTFLLRKLPLHPVIPSRIQHHYLLDILPQIFKCQRRSAGDSIRAGFWHWPCGGSKTKLKLVGITSDATFVFCLGKK